jgi:hypothetical protein
MPNLYINSAHIPNFDNKNFNKKCMIIRKVSKKLGYKINYYKGYLIIYVLLGDKLPSKKEIINLFI